MNKQVYSAKDIQEITGKGKQYSYDLIRKLQKMLYRENPNYKVGLTATIPKWFFDKIVLGKEEIND